MQELTEGQKTFANDIIEGLSQTTKQLPSKYFYDSEGDRLFQEIMALDEYYLTNAEESIIYENKQDILESFIGTDSSFRLVELGAGDGKKTKILLEHFMDQEIDFTYSPIDISANVLTILKESISSALPKVDIQPIAGDYFKALKDLKKNHLQKEVVLFLGSTIGNFDNESGLKFLKKLGENMTKGDLLFIGFDLMKEPDVILAAYNDKRGVTAEFNYNLLKRINKELKADFDIENFIHYPTYDPISGETKSYLISKKKQQVSLNALDKAFTFEEWEPIFMEVSLKFSQSSIQVLAQEAGFKVVKNFRDSKGYFQDSLWVKL